MLTFRVKWNVALTSQKLSILFMLLSFSLLIFVVLISHFVYNFVYILQLINDEAFFLLTILFTCLAVGSSVYFDNFEVALKYFSNYWYNFLLYDDVWIIIQIFHVIFCYSILIMCYVLSLFKCIFIKVYFSNNLQIKFLAALFLFV